MKRFLSLSLCVLLAAVAVWLIATVERAGSFLVPTEKMALFAAGFAAIGGGALFLLGRWWALGVIVATVVLVVAQSRETDGIAWWTGAVGAVALIAFALGSFPPRHEAKPHRY